MKSQRYPKPSAYILTCLMSTLPSFAGAATFYVSSSGSDSNSGQASTSPWQTLEYASKNISNGDTLLLRAGDTFYEVNPVTFRGNDMLISSYGSGPKPVVSGFSKQTNKSHVEPGGKYSGQVIVGDESGANGHRTTIENIELKQASGFGLKIYADNVNVRNILVNEPFLTGIICYETCSGITVENSEVYRHNWGYVYGPENGFEKLCDGCWGGGLVMRGNNFTWRNNYIHEGWGEGIMPMCGAYKGLIEGNRSIANRVQIYIGTAQDIVVRNNLVGGTTNKEYWRGSSPGPGIGINNEPFCEQQATSNGLETGSKRITITNNLVSYTSVGMFMWAEVSSSSFEDIAIVNNTFIDNDYEFQAIQAKVSNLIVKNNIFAALSAPQNSVKSFNISGTFSFDHNYWNTKPSYSAVLGANDIYSGLTLSKNSGWRQTSSPLDYKADFFKPLSSSSTIAKGTTPKDWSNSLLATDYFGTLWGQAPDIGAMKATLPVVPPNPPAEFIIE